MLLSCAGDIIWSQSLHTNEWLDGMLDECSQKDDLDVVPVMYVSSTWQVSVDAVRQLDRNLFEAYIERRADPIAGSLEPGIYAGYFDWRDCQTPTGTVQLHLTPHVFVSTSWCGGGDHLQQPQTDPGDFRREPQQHGNATHQVWVWVCCGSYVSFWSYLSLMTYCKHCWAHFISLMAFEFSSGCALVTFHQRHCRPRWNFNAYMWFTLAPDVKQHVGVCEWSAWISWFHHF